MNWRKFFQKRKTIYLHAGMSKTGTTSIQKMLSQNKDLLSENDVYYPQTARTNSISHHAFAGYVKQGKQPELGDKLRQEIDACAQSKIIISTELLERVRPERWEFVKTLFLPHKVEIIYYLRRQDDAIISMYNELTKKHATSLPFHEYIHVSPRIDLLDYRTTLANIEGVFGENSLNIGVFSSANLHKGDIGKDFMLKVLGDTPVVDKFSAPHDNSSLLPATAMLMARINRHVNFAIDHAQHYGLACKLAQSIDKVIRSQTKVKHAYFRDFNERTAFLNNFAISNDYISDHYLSGKSFIQDNLSTSAPILSDEEELDLLTLIHTQLVGETIKDGASINEIATSIGLFWKGKLDKALGRT